MTQAAFSASCVSCSSYIRDLDVTTSHAALPVCPPQFQMFLLRARTLEPECLEGFHFALLRGFGKEKKGLSCHHHEENMKI